MSINHKILNQLGLFSPKPDRNDVVGRDVLRVKQYDVDALQVYVEAQKRLLTNDQRLTYNTVMKNVRGGNGGLIFFNAPGGTEKTFQLNLIFAEIRMNHEIALAVIWHHRRLYQHYFTAFRCTAH